MALPVVSALFLRGKFRFVLEHPSPYAGPKEALARLIHVKFVLLCTVSVKTFKTYVRGAALAGYADTPMRRVDREFIGDLQ
jgi:hypothetical protein